MSREAVLEPERTIFVTKLEEEPQLGGEGSGFPPRWLVGTGSLDHAIIGIDIGSHWTRVASVVRNRPTLITAPVSSILRPGLEDGGSIDYGKPTCSLLSLIGTDWESQVDRHHFSEYFDSADALNIFLRQVIEHSQSGAEHLIKKCVVTVPACFTSERRRQLRELLEQVGLDVLHIMNETTAAALYYAYEFPELEGNVLFVGMGANHSAASVIEIRNGILETKATSALDHLGGDDYDNAIVEWLFSKYRETHGTRLPRVTKNIEQFKLAAERAKQDLSMSEKSYVRLTSLASRKDPLDFDRRDLFLDIKRVEFARLTEALTEQFMQHVHRALLEARLNYSDIDYVIPVGAAMQMPQLLDAVRCLFPSKRRWSFGQQNTATFPAFGAALQASILTRNLRDYVVWDVLPVPICVELPDGLCKTVVSSGTPLPVTGYHQVESTSATVNLHVMQGYSQRAEDNCSIAEVTVNNCPPTSSAQTKVEIAIMVRPDGTVDFASRHVELQVNLPVSVRRGHPTPLKRKGAEPDVVLVRMRDPLRLARLCRKLNMSEVETLATLKSLRYSELDIANGRAIEDLVRKLRTRK